MAITARGVPYPTPGAPPDVAQDIYDLAEWINDYLGHVAFTTTDRDALTGDDLWDGRFILNTTLGQLQWYADGDDSWHTVADLTHAQTLAAKTLAVPVVRGPQESVTVNAGGMGATVTVDALTRTVVLYAGNSTANSTVNVRGDGTHTLDASLAIGDSLTVVLLVTNGATAYRPTAFQIDGGAVTPKWAGGAAPAAGNANSIDAYSYTIIKTAAATFTVLGSYGRYS